VTGLNNGNLSATLGTLKHKGWVSSATLANALHGLQALGFIAKTRGGGVANGSTVCCLYRFTDLNVLEVPKLAIPATSATHDYLQFENLAQAKRALEQASAERLERAKKETKKRGRKKTTLQKLKHYGSETERQSTSNSSETEVEALSTVQKMKSEKAGANGPKSHAARGFQPDHQGNSSRPSPTSENEHLYMLPPLPAGNGPLGARKTTGKTRAAPSATKVTP
jgi:hypothetical protein